MDIFCSPLENFLQKYAADSKIPAEILEILKLFGFNCEDEKLPKNAWRFVGVTAHP